MEKKKDYVNALAKAHIETSKFQFTISNYLFFFLFVASIIMTLANKPEIAFYGFVFSGFYFLLVRTTWKSYIKKIDRALED